MEAMVGFHLKHSGGLSSSDCQPCFRCDDSSHPCLSYRKEDAARFSLFSPVSKARLEIGFSRTGTQFRRLCGSKESWVLEISLAFWKAGNTYATTVAAAAAAKRSSFTKSEFMTRAASGNGEFECGNDGRIIATCSTEGGGGNGSTSAEEGQNESRGNEEGDGGEGIAAAAKADTVAEGVSTTELLEKFEGSDATDWKSGEPEISNSQEDGRRGLLDERFLRRVGVAENADVVLSLIADREPETVGGGISTEDCAQMILAALAQHNVDLAFSILASMRCSLFQRRIDRQEDSNGEKGRKWGWPQPDVTTYAVLARGLAASLRVSDAVQIVGDVQRRGVPQGDEVPFGKVVNCPTCKTSLAVVQPQHGIQLVPCATCRYQYELMSGVIVSSESESVSSDTSFWEKSLEMLPFLNFRVPAAIHSIVVRAPDGLAQTLRFATLYRDVPAQEGERVTMVLASPSNADRRVGPIRFNARVPGWKPREPMAVTNHITGQVLSLMRAPSKTGSRAAFDTSVIVPLAIFLASTDAASGLIDPNLPRLVTLGAATAVAFGGVVNTLILPRLNQLPQRTVDAIALRQHLLAQYGQLQARLQELTEAASNEVRMLARMCQLQNKMEAVGEASYSARIERVQKAREGLDERLAARLELLDSYAKVASMIEIEVEMDIDVLAAEAASPEATIAEQIERLMEVESLQKGWKNQAEANDELERLLRVAPCVPDSG